MSFSHVSVMLEECLDALKPERGGIFVDCTAGGGGHSYEIAKRLCGRGRVISLDRDDDAVTACKERLTEFKDISTVVKANFSDIDSVLDLLEIEKIDGILWDLGVSSHQLDIAERGFSYMSDAPLDMRMDRNSSFSAYDVVNLYDEESLARIISEYGEERFASRVAGAIVKKRKEEAIKTTKELADVVSEAIPKAARYGEAQHPARRTFQAVRIEVNKELDEIRDSLKAAVSRLNPGGIAAVITFHSLEDRIVKQTFSDLAKGCTCPPEFPVCVCGKTPEIKIITKKPICPSQDEISANPRSRSAKLRVCEKL